MANTRITEFGEIVSVTESDEIPIIDKDDLTDSPDGSSRKITTRNLVETTPVRPSNNQTVSNTLAEWVATFRDNINTIGNNTAQATTTQRGTVRLATNSQARAKTNTENALVPSNLGNLIASDTVHGLLRAAVQADFNTPSNEAAITPVALLAHVLGDSVFGSNSNVFKIPVKDQSDDSMKELIIQYGEETGNSIFEDTDPSINPNHTHGFIDIGVTFPQPFPTKVLLVLPVGYEVDGAYTEGTDFFFRPTAQDVNSATIRGSRIAGTNETSEQVGVRYIAIGY